MPPRRQAGKFEHLCFQTAKKYEGANFDGIKQHGGVCEAKAELRSDRQSTFLIRDS
jgi:hypothetical protein